MNQRRLVGAASLLLVLLCFTPSIASNQHPSSYSQRTETSQNADEEEAKKIKEEEIRKETEKRAEVEKQKQQDADDAARAEEDKRKAQELEDQEREDKAKEEAREKEEEKTKEELLQKEEEKAKEEVRQKEEEKAKEEARQAEEDKAKEEARQAEERRKEEEARLEVEKRERLERQREHEHRYHYHPSENTTYYPAQDSDNEDAIIVVIPQNVTDSTTIPTSTGTVAAPSGTNPGTTPANASGTVSPDRAVIPPPSPSPVSPYSGNRYYPDTTESSSYASLLFAPGSGDRKPAVGIQYMTKKNYGIGLWFSGDFGQDDDVIETTIPHDDYYTESRTATYGVEGLYAVGSNKAALIVGVGVSVEQTTFTDISNATGWKWDGGSSKSVKPAAQIGCRFQVGGRASLQLGYDSTQASYFGLSAAF